MRFIEGIDRRQAALFPVSLDDRIESDNEVRDIDAFVQGLDLEKLGFKVHFPENGRPAYHPSVLLKLFIYGYMNRIRSSRMLERECGRNLELMWLLNSLMPTTTPSPISERTTRRPSNACSAPRWSWPRVTT